LSSGSSCLDSQTVLPGQIGVISDAAVVPCKPYKPTDDTHQCLILTNPYQAALKVFDISDNQFVLSPVAYFPLVIKVGLTPNKIVVAKGQIFTLDPSDKKIYIIPGDFKSPVTQTLPEPTKSNTAFAITIDSAGKPTPHLSESGDTNVLATPDQAYLLRTNGASLTIETLGTGLKTPVTLPSSIASITADSTRALVGLTDKTLIFVNLADGKLGTPSKALSAIPAAVYLPTSLAGTPSTCCNSEEQWVAALAMDGTLQYWPYAEGKFKAPQIIDIQLVTGIGSFALTNPIKLLGATVENPGQDGLSCNRRLFLIYSGSIFNTCEGNSNIKRIDQMEY
jgi:hypothetical protein